MVSLNRTTAVQNSRVLYNIGVRDNTPDVEFDTFDFEFIGNSMGLSTEIVENAIRAFADYIVSTSENFSTYQFTKTQVIESNLSL